MSTDANLTALQADARTDTTDKTVFKILLAISFCHLLTDVNFVYHVCSFLPAIGILTALLPDLAPFKTPGQQNQTG